MRKTYIFLVLMIIILPSIGMTRYISTHTHARTHTPHTRTHTPTHSLSALAELALDGEVAIEEKLQ